jgi:hypothetical protein
MWLHKLFTAAQVSITRLVLYVNVAACCDVLRRGRLHMRGYGSKNAFLFSLRHQAT